MRYKVTQPFTDDELSFRRQVGDIIEISDERMKQMEENAKVQGLSVDDFVEVIKEDKKKQRGGRSCKIGGCHAGRFEDIDRRE